MRILHIAAALLVLAIAATPAFPHGFKVGNLVIHHPWARATAPGAPVAGGYAEITNEGTTDDILVAATFENAERVEIHQMSMEGDVMKMAKLNEGLPIPAGKTVALKPGSFHLMLMGPKAPLVEGEMVKGTLTFAKAGVVNVEFVVEAMVKKDPAHDGHAEHDPAKMN
ncbi:MAG: copper chaperone PCu(A)C [Alphaproteobacteria bacterium]